VHFPWLLLVVLVAAAARLAYNLEIRSYVLYRVPLVDAQEYVEWARNLARGGAELADAYYKAPFYPHFLSWCMRLLGPGVETAYLVNALLGLANVVLLWAWGRRVVGERTALVAAGLAAVYGPFLYYEMQPMPTTLAMTLSLSTLVLLRDGREAPARWRAGLAGVALGALVLTRPSFLVWLGLAVVWVVARAPRARAARAGLMAAVALLCIAPVTWVNHARSGRWVLVSANAGINFYLGNNPDAARTSVLRPGLQWEELVTSPPEAARRGQAAWDGWFGSRGLAWARAQPGRFVAGLGQKTLQYFDAHPIDRNLDVRGFEARSRVLRAAPNYAWLAPWIPLGLLVAWRRRRASRLAALFWIANALATVLFFVTERYRIDAAPAAILLALLAVRELVQRARRQPVRLRAPATAVLVVAGFVLSFGNFGGIRALYPARAATLEGTAYYAKGDFERAKERLQAAVTEDSTDADAHYQLGSAFLKQNQLPEALAQYERAHALVPRNPKPLFNAGFVLQALGRAGEAHERYAQVLQVTTDPQLTAATRQRVAALEASSPAPAVPPVPGSGTPP
jgi:tetratricopeptide (TPR) repeat protein